MSYSAVKEGNSYAIYSNGQRISTGSAATLQNYGLSESQLSSPATSAPTGIGNTVTAAQTVPAASSPITPSVQPSTPAPPVAQQPTYSGVQGQGTGSIVPQSTTPTMTQPSTQASQAVTQTATQPLATPATGSVVDLLNAAGQDSSFAARQQLAQQFGIQSYTGTAAQNQDLAKKFTDAYNAKKGTVSPESGAEASSALQEHFADTTLAEDKDPIKSFMDSYSSMDPVMASLFQQISTLVSSTSNQQSLTDFYKQEMAAQGIPELNMQLADVNRIINGTEQDIRDEVEKSGGFATNSQILALSSARNKVLLQNAQYLSDVINAKNDYVDHIVSLTQADRQQVSEDLNRRIGLTKTLVDMSQQMQNNAKEGYQSVINEIGWSGLAQTVAGNPTQASNIEQLFGLAPGELSALSSYKAPVSEMDQLKLENQKLQNQKLQQELAKVPASQVTPAQKVLADSIQQQTIADTSSLVKDPGLNSAVGPNFLSRIAVADAFGAKSNFIASVEQLRQQLTLDKLVAAKGSGATFGALSDAELQLLSASASKLGTWAIKDNAGNVTGYNIDETSFKKELDKINNFQKLDFVLKGGDPASVGVFQASDGSLVTKNSDGSVTKL